MNMCDMKTVPLEAAFLHLRELSTDLGLHINYSKSEWFNAESSKNRNSHPDALRSLGVTHSDKTIKILGAYIGDHQEVSLTSGQKTKEAPMPVPVGFVEWGPSNISLAVLQRCALPRHDYHLRVHRPEDSLLMAQKFDEQVNDIVSHWFFADSISIKLSSLPQHLGGLGLTPSTLKHRFFFDTRAQID